MTIEFLRQETIMKIYIIWTHHYREILPVYFNTREDAQKNIDDDEWDTELEIFELSSNK